MPKHDLSDLTPGEFSVLRKCLHCHQREYDYRTSDPAEVEALRNLAGRGLVLVPEAPLPTGELPASYKGPEVL